MRSVKSFIAAGAATLLSSAAFAADMAIAPPPYAPPVVEDFGGWYLRGDIGFSNQRVNDSSEWRSVSSLLSLEQNNSFNTAGIFGLGVGYRFNNWFRADVTGQYRGNSNFLATDRSSSPMPALPTLVSTPIPAASPNGWSWPTPMWISAPGGASRPFIGAGVGCARVTISASPMPASSNQCSGPRSVSRLRDNVDRSGILPGLRMLVSPTGSRRTSPSNSPIAISNLGDGTTGDISDFRRSPTTIQSEIQAHHLA